MEMKAKMDLGQKVIQISVDEEFSSSDEETESETEEEIKEDSTESKSDSTDMPSKCKKINERKTQIKLKSNTRSNWEIPSEYSINTKKISLNTDNPLTRFCSPISFFKIFVNDKTINLISEQSKLYNQWRSLNSSEEIKIVIGIVLQMGIVKLPNRRMYWTPNYRNDLLVESMTQNRFDEIMMVLHFNDNNSMKDKDSPIV